MSKEENKKPFDNAFEIFLKGTPGVLSPIISTVANELNFEGWKYDVVEEKDSATSAYTKFLIQVHRAEKESTYLDCIGIITLQLLPENQTLFRIPPCQQWHFRTYMEFSDGRRIPMFIQEKEFYSKTDESFLTELIRRLFSEFQQLGFIDFREKPPIGFRLPRKEKDV